MTDKTVIADLGPRRVGKYRVGGILGEGAMGVVYAGHDPDIERPVAIKTIHKHLIEAAGGEDWLVRFAREARAAGRVLHPNLVTIFDYLEIDGTPYLVMERIQSITLEDRLARPEGLDLAEVRTILTQILDGLDCIHAAGIVHRDMKPANVMLTNSGGVKLTDFGIARLTAMEKTGAGMVGTPHYMAPEQFSGGDVDARADIYATGVLLYEVLTGKRPFEGGGIEAMLRASRSEPVAAPSTLVAGLPAQLDAVVLKAISVDPAGRFDSAWKMQDALVAALDGTGHVALNNAERPTMSPATPTMLTRMSAATLTQVEQNLVSKIGPIGRVVARKAAATATDVDQLVELVLAELRPGAEQNDMGKSLRNLLSSNVIPASRDMSEADLSRIAQALTKHLGPISSLLVKREAAQAQSLAALVQALAESIPEHSARETFVVEASNDTSEGSRHV